MPTSIAVAVASSVAADAIGVWVGSAIIGKLAGAAIGVALTSALSGSQDSDEFGAGAAAVESRDRTLTVRQAVAPHVTIYGRVRVGGTITYLETTDNNEYMHVVVTIAGHVVDEIETLYLGDDPVDLGVDGYATGKYSGYVYAAFSDGAEAAQPFPALVYQSASLWTDAHRQTGRAKVYVRLRWSSDLFANGMPNITVIVRGKKVYDPRAGTAVWSDNAALCVADYLCDTRAGLGCVYADDIDETALIAAANVCDEDVTLAAGGTENRYTCNGIVYATEKPRDVIPKLLGAMQGRATWIGGKWRISAGAYATPTVTLTADDFRGGISVQSRISKRDLFNSVKGVFVSPENNWQPSDFPPVTSATYQAEDDDERIWQDIRLPFTDSASMAQRLARIELERVRRQITVTAPLRFSAYRLQPGDTVQLTFSRFGWTAKTFEVVESTFVVGEDGGLGVDLVLRETDANVYAWTTADEGAFVAASRSWLPDPFVVGQPVNVVVQSGTAALIVAADGTVHSRIGVSWDVAADAYVRRGGRVLVEYSEAGANDWAAVEEQPGDATQAWVAPVDDGVAYDVRVRFRNWLGVQSAAVVVEGHVVVGKTAPPADVTTFLVDGRRLAWGAVADVDLAGYRLRYHQGTRRSWGDAVPLHAGLVTDNPWTPAVLPSGICTLMIKAVDSSGNESAHPAYIVTELGDPVVANVLVQYDLAALGWAGTITNGSVSGGDVVADATTLMWNVNTGSAMWADDPATLMWAAAVYERLTYEDRITVASVLAGSSMTISATITGDPWTIDYRENSAARMWAIDTSALMWTDDAALMWDTPAWQSWPGHVTVSASMYDFRVMAGQGPTQGVVDAFVITIDAPDVIERLADVVIGSGGTRLPITAAFDTVQSVQLTVQADGGSAISARVEDKSATLGPLVRCLDAAGAAVAGTVDAVVQGF